MKLLDLPNELLLWIINFSDPVGYQSLVLTCKRLHNLCKCEIRQELLEKFLRTVDGYSKLNNGQRHGICKVQTNYGYMRSNYVYDLLVGNVHLGVSFDFGFLKIQKLHVETFFHINTIYVYGSYFKMIIPAKYTGKWLFVEITSGHLLGCLTFVNGLRNGPCEIRYLNGNIKVIGQYKDDKKVGIFTFMKSNGDVHKYVTYDDDKPNGECVVYYENKVSKVYQIKDGYKHGSYMKYDLSGRIIVKCNYLRNRLNGRYIEYDTNEREITNTYYHNGNQSRFPR